MFKYRFYNMVRIFKLVRKSIRVRPMVARSLFSFVKAILKKTRENFFHKKFSLIVQKNLCFCSVRVSTGKRESFPQGCEKLCGKATKRRKRCSFSPFFVFFKCFLQNCVDSLLWKTPVESSMRFTILSSFSAPRTKQGNFDGATLRSRLF